MHLEKNLDACQVVETEDEKSVISLLSENPKDDKKITNNSVGSPQIISPQKINRKESPKDESFKFTPVLSQKK